MPYSGADPENSERSGRVPHSPPRMKTSLQPADCMIITTLKKQLEGLGSYKNILKIEEKKGGRFPLDPSPKSAYVILFFIKHNTCLVKISNIHRLLTVCFYLDIRQEVYEVMMFQARREWNGIWLCTAYAPFVFTINGETPI